MEGDAMLWPGQEGRTRGPGSEHAGLALDTELALSPQWRATRRTTESERWILRLSQMISHRTLGAALLLSKRRRKRAKSFSVRVLPITPSTLPVATSKAAIRV